MPEGLTAITTAELDLICGMSIDAEEAIRERVATFRANHADRVRMYKKTRAPELAVSAAAWARAADAEESRAYAVRALRETLRDRRPL